MVDLLVFELDAERYGLRTAQVRELVRAVAVSRLPAAPAIVQGVIDVRGELVAVLDLRARFGLPPRAVRAQDHFVLAATRERPVALHVDRAIAVVSVAEGAVESVRGAFPGSQQVQGAVRLADGLVFIHDLEGFLHAAENAELSTALAHAGSAP